MIPIWRNLVLGLGLCVAFAACADDPAGLDDVPELVVEEGVRFHAIASEGTESREINVQLELHNTGKAARNFGWNECGIEIRLYRSESLVYDSQRSGGPCEDIGHMAVAYPSES